MSKKSNVKKPAGLAAASGSGYRAMRRAKALTRGSEWVFFRDGDEKLKDPWAALEIKIVKASVRRGKMRLVAECTQPHMIKKHARRVPSQRRVKYSELW